MTFTTRETHRLNFNEDELFAPVDRTMEKFNFGEEDLVEVLITAQEAFGFLSKDLLTHVSNKLHIPLSRVYGVATFYDMYTLEPSGATDCLVCTGPSCTIAGGEKVLAEICSHTGVSEPGQSSIDGQYKVNQVSGVGFGDQAPAPLINN